MYKNIISYGGLKGGQDNGIAVNNTLVIWKDSRRDTTTEASLNALKLRLVFVCNVYSGLMRGYYFLGVLALVVRGL